MSRIHQNVPFLLLLVFLSACGSTSEASSTPTSVSPAQPSLLYLRSNAPDGELQLFLRQGLDDPGRHLMVHLSSSRAVWDLRPAPRGRVVALELDCGYGMTVMLLDIDQESTSLPAAQ